jgi:hypothetical protein
MNERDRRLIQEVRELRVFGDLYAQGVTPDDLKRSLMEMFAPYSQNRRALDDYVVERMVPDAVSLRSISDHQWAMGLFAEALHIQRESLGRDRAAGLQCLSSHLERINSALSIYWSQYHISVGMWMNSTLRSLFMKLFA